MTEQTTSNNNFSTNSTNNSSTDWNASATNQNNNPSTDWNASTTNQTNNSSTDWNASTTNQTNNPSTDWNASTTNQTNNSSTNWTAPTTMEGAYNQEGTRKVQWASFIEGDIANSFTSWQLEKMTLEDGNGNKAKLAKTKDGGIKVEYTSTTTL